MQRRCVFLIALCVCLLCASYPSAAQACGDENGGTTASWPPNCPGDLFPDKGSNYGLNWLGSFEYAPNVPDHLMSTNILDADRLVVASANRMIVVGRNPIDNVLPQYTELITDHKLPSNLDGATLGSHFFHKFFNAAVYKSYVYVATRYDPMYAFQITGLGADTVITRKWMAPKSRTFTENLQVVKDKLYAAHHADGVEVFSLANPALPVSLATLKLTDSWNLAVRTDGNMLIADGAAGLQWVQYEASTKTLTRIAGDTVATSPGVTFDVAFVGVNTAITAIGGQGVAVYYFNPTDPDQNHRLVRMGTFSLPGTCVDIEKMNSSQAVLACRNWVHVIEVNSTTGTITTLASAQMHRRLGRQPWPAFPSTNLASHVKVSGDKIYVTAWDHVDEYQLVSNANIPDIRLSTHRVHFGSGAGVSTITVANGGTATLNISKLVQSSSPDVVCTLDSMSILPGATANLAITYDGASSVRDDVGCSLQSNDPDDGTTASSSVAIPIYANMAKYVDPGETPPEFFGNTMLRDYASELTTTAPFDLASYLNPNATDKQVLHLAIWGSW